MEHLIYILELLLPVHMMCDEYAIIYRSPFLSPPPLNNVLHDYSSALSEHSREILERILSASSDSQVIQFLLSMCHTSACSFLMVDKFLLFSCTGNPPQLTIASSAKPQELHAMETSAQCVITLLQTSLQSRHLIGQFFNECMSQFASIVSKDVKVDSGSLSDRLKGVDSSSQSSSALLECEQAMPKALSERLSEAQILYVTAALCQGCSEVILREACIPSLLKSCLVIVESHTTGLRGDKVGEEVLLVPGGHSRVEITGGHVSLSIALGLVLAILSGAETVSELPDSWCVCVWIGCSLWLAFDSIDVVFSVTSAYHTYII